MVQEMENLLKHGSRVEVLIEQGKVAIVEVKRKLRHKE
jgi:translation elongation factor P/translation initiation factor 5A